MWKRSLCFILSSHFLGILFPSNGVLFLTSIHGREKYRKSFPSPGIRKEGQLGWEKTPKLRIPQSKGSKLDGLPDSVGEKHFLFLTLSIAHSQGSLSWIWMKSKGVREYGGSSRRDIKFAIPKSLFELFNLSIYGGLFLCFTEVQNTEFRSFSPSSLAFPNPLENLTPYHRDLSSSYWWNFSNGKGRKKWWKGRVGKASLLFYFSSEVSQMMLVANRKRERSVVDLLFMIVS